MTTFYLAGRQKYIVCYQDSLYGGLDFERADVMDCSTFQNDASPIRLVCRGEEFKAPWLDLTRDIKEALFNAPPCCQRYSHRRTRFRRGLFSKYVRYTRAWQKYKIRMVAVRTVTATDCRQQVSLHVSFSRAANKATDANILPRTSHLYVPVKSHVSDSLQGCLSRLQQLQRPGQCRASATARVQPLICTIQLWLGFI